jgi:hypothetical protein
LKILFKIFRHSYNSTFTIFQGLNKYSTHLPRIGNNRSSKLKNENSYHEFVDFKNLKQSRDGKNNIFNLLHSYIPKLEQNWTFSKKLNLLDSLISKNNNEISQILAHNVKNQVKKIKADMNNLPDSLLLYIFSYLDFKILDNIIPYVCRQWRHLVNTNELWIHKCQKLGENAKLSSKIEYDLISELYQNEEIDWKMAFVELENFILELKSNDLKLCEKESVKSIIFPNVCKNKIDKRDENVQYVNFYQDEEKMIKKIKTQEKMKKGKKKSLNQYELVLAMDDYYIKHQKDFINTISFENRKESLKDDNIGLDEKKSKLSTVNSIESKISDGEVCNKIEQILTLKQIPDLTKNIQPQYKLRWKLENENIQNFSKTNEKIIYQMNKVLKLKTLKDHTNKVLSMDYDDKRLVTCSLDRLIFVYDIKNGNLLGKLVGHMVF